ncbi:MAG TPA: hypothetical protein VGA22_13185 [Gemmatimonadales bacterium]
MVGEHLSGSAIGVRFDGRTRLIPWVIAGCLAACAGQPPSHSPPEPVPPQAFAYSPFTASYLFVSRGHTRQQIPGGEAANTEYAFTIGLTAAVATDGENLMATVTVDSVPMLSGAAALVAGNITRAVGKSVRARMLPNGRLVSDDAPDPALGSLPQVASLLQDFFPRIPETGVTAGDRWIDSTSNATHSNGLDLTTEAVRTYEAADGSDSGTGAFLEVVAEVVYTLTGSGVMSAQPIVVEGAGARRERFFLAANGAFLGGITRDSSAANATMSSIGVTIPIVQTRTDTLRIIP